MTDPVTLLRAVPPASARPDSAGPDACAEDFADLVPDDESADGAPDDAASPSVAAWPWLAVQPALVIGLAGGAEGVEAALGGDGEAAPSGATTPDRAATGDTMQGPEGASTARTSVTPDTALPPFDGAPDRSVPATETASGRLLTAAGTADGPFRDLTADPALRPVPMPGLRLMPPPASPNGSAGADLADEPAHDDDLASVPAPDPGGGGSDAANANRPPADAAETSFATLVRHAATHGAEAVRTPGQTGPGETGRPMQHASVGQAAHDGRAGEPADTAAPVAVSLRAASGDSALLRLTTTDGALADLLRAHLPELGDQLRDMGFQTMALDVADLFADPADDAEGPQRDQPGGERGSARGDGRGDSRSDSRNDSRGPSGGWATPQGSDGWSDRPAADPSRARDPSTIAATLGPADADTDATASRASAALRRAVGRVDLRL